MGNPQHQSVWQIVKQRRRRRTRKRNTAQPDAQQHPAAPVITTTRQPVVAPPAAPPHMFRLSDFVALSATVAAQESALEQLEANRQQAKLYISAAAAAVASNVASTDAPIATPPPRPPPGPPPPGPPAISVAPCCPRDTNVAKRQRLLVVSVLPLLVQTLGNVNSWAHGTLESYLALLHTPGDVVHKPNMYVLVLPDTPGSMVRASMLWLCHIFCRSQVFAVTCMVFSSHRLSAWHALWNSGVTAEARIVAIYRALNDVPNTVLQLLIDANGLRGGGLRGLDTMRSLVAMQLGGQRSFLRCLLLLNGMMVNLCAYERSHWQTCNTHRC